MTNVDDGQPDESMTLDESDIGGLIDDLIEPEMLAGVERECTKLLESETGKSAPAALARLAIQLAETVWENLQEDAPDFACRKGCAWCCHLTVMVTAPEVFVLVEDIKAGMSAEEVERLAARVKKNAQMIRGKNTIQRFAEGIACGLLDGDSCSAHATRPMPCHGAFSEDAKFCEALFDDHDTAVETIASGQRQEPFLVMPKMIFNSAQFGMVRALREKGHGCRPLELTVALDIAFSHPDIESAWLEDESVFEAAELHQIGGQYVTKPPPSP